MSIAIVGMLDEREEALRIIKDQIERRGIKTCLIDISIGNGASVPSLQADVSAREVAESVEGTGITAGPPAADEKHTAISRMGEGLKRKILSFRESEGLQGIIAVAGMTGTLISLQAMKALPFGFPKLLLSSAAAMPAHASQLAEYFALKDITVMHTVVDTVGVNRLVRALAMNGANAISGMVESGEPLLQADRPSLAITEFGFCDRGAHYIREILGEDYEIVSFHAIGLGDMVAIDFVRQGYFQAFLDLVPGTFSEHLFGGNRASGPDRLDIAMDRPIPYVFCPGGFDMISCGPLERRDRGDVLWSSRRLAERKLNVQDALRVHARTSVEEMEQLGTVVAEKLNRYEHKGRVKVVIPRKGFSTLSVEGGPLYDPVADGAFIAALRRGLDPQIGVTEVDTDINSRDFAWVVKAALSDASRAAGDEWHG
jgi:uncharacterized protein (UPF0261 family)